MVSHLNSSPSGTPSNFFQAPLPFLLAPTSESSHILTENIKPIPIYHVWKTAHWLNTYHPCIFRPANRYEIVMVNMPSLVNMPLLSPGKWWKCTTLLSLKSNFTATHPKYGKIECLVISYQTSEWYIPLALWNQTTVKSLRSHDTKKQRNKNPEK